MATKAELREFLAGVDYFSDEDLQQFVQQDSEVGSLRSAQGVAGWAGWVKPPGQEMWARKDDTTLRAPKGSDDLKDPDPSESPIQDLDADRVQRTRFSQIEREIGAPPTQNPDAEKWFRILRGVGTNANLAATTSLMLAEIPQEDLPAIKGALADIKLLTLNQRESAYNIFSRQQGTVPLKKDGEAEGAPVTGMNKPIWGAVAGEVIPSQTQGMTHAEAEAWAGGQRRREARETPQPPPQLVQPTADPLEVVKVIAETAASPQDTLEAIQAGREMAAGDGPPPQQGMDPGSITLFTTMMANSAEEARANRETQNAMLAKMSDDREERRHSESMEMMRNLMASMTTSKKGELTELVETLGAVGISIPELVGRFLNPQKEITTMMDGVQVTMTPHDLLEMRKVENQRASIDAIKDSVIPTVVDVFERMQRTKAVPDARPMPGHVPAAEAQPEPAAEPEVQTESGEQWPCTNCQTIILVADDDHQVECKSCGAKYLTAAGYEWIKAQPLIDQPPTAEAAAEEERPAVVEDDAPVAEADREAETVEEPAVEAAPVA